MATLQELGELKIWEALQANDGHVVGAAQALDVTRATLQKALNTWAKHLGEGAAALRTEAGYHFGRPGEAELHVRREKFLRVWDEEERKILRVANRLSLDRFAVRRLARVYDAPGAPPARKRE